MKGAHTPINLTWKISKTMLVSIEKDDIQRKNAMIS